jgi:hypothetical protein
MVGTPLFLFKHQRRLFAPDTFLLPHEPHIHRRHTPTLGPNHDGVDLHVGEMIPMRGEDIGQSNHRFNQRVDVARALAAHAFEQFVPDWGLVRIGAN